jgi:hypothetical protein
MNAKITDISEILNDDGEQFIFCKGHLDKDVFLKLAKEFLKDNYGDDVEIELDEPTYSSARWTYDFPNKRKWLYLSGQSGKGAFKVTAAQFNIE